MAIAIAFVYLVCPVLFSFSDEVRELPSPIALNVRRERIKISPSRKIDVVARVRMTLEISSSGRLHSCLQGYGKSTSICLSFRLFFLLLLNVRPRGLHTSLARSRLFERFPSLTSGCEAVRRSAHHILASRSTSAYPPTRWQMATRANAMI